MTGLPSVPEVTPPADDRPARAPIDRLFDLVVEAVAREIEAGTLPDPDPAATAAPTEGDAHDPDL